MNILLGGLAALIAGGTLATVTVVGVVSNQTSPEGKSPTNVNAPVIPYGTNGLTDGLTS